MVERVEERRGVPTALGSDGAELNSIVRNGPIRNQEYQNSVQEEEHGLRKPVRDELRN